MPLVPQRQLNIMNSKSIEWETFLQQAESRKLASCTFFHITLSEILNQHQCISIEHRSEMQLVLIHASPRKIKHTHIASWIFGILDSTSFSGSAENMLKYLILLTNCQKNIVANFIFYPILLWLQTKMFLWFGISVIHFKVLFQENIKKQKDINVEK